MATDFEDLLFFVLGCFYGIGICLLLWAVTKGGGE